MDINFDPSLRSRRFVLNTFPYKIVYTVKENQIFVLAIVTSIWLLSLPKYIFALLLNYPGSNVSLEQKHLATEMI